MTKDDVRENLILAYNRAVEERDQRDVPPWKQGERERVLQLLLEEEKSTLVDLGSGPGIHAQFFRDRGLDVTCLDLSSENIKRCLEKGLKAHELDLAGVASLGIQFDAAFAMNSLLHVPRADLHDTLASISGSLNPGGLFYWGQYGGRESEGIYGEDRYEPKRFFSLLTDRQIADEASKLFSLEQFATIELEDGDELHYQSLLLRVSATGTNTA